MSAAHMGLVFAAKGLDGSEKLLLLALTNYTDPHGYCWPSEERLADDCGTSRSTVQRVKRKLTARNLIKSVRRTDPRTQEPISNLTRVNLELLASMSRQKARRYEDNMLEILFGPDSETSPDLLKGHIDSHPEADRLTPRVILTPPPGQDDSQSLTDPVENPYAPSARSAPDARRAPAGSRDISLDAITPRGNHGVSLSPERGDSQTARHAPGSRPTDRVPEFPDSGPTCENGSSARSTGGFAASGKTKPRLTHAQRVLVDEVLALLPTRLREAPELVRPPRNVQDAVLEALAVDTPRERTPEQLVEFRVLPRWDRYWASALFARDMAQPVGPLVAMLKRDPLCNDDRCDEHVEVDSGLPCRVCGEVRKDARAARGGGRGSGQAGVGQDVVADAVVTVLPAQRRDEEEARTPAPIRGVSVAGGAEPNEEYRAQRAAARLRRAGG